MADRALVVEAIIEEARAKWPVSAGWTRSSSLRTPSRLEHVVDPDH